MKKLVIVMMVLVLGAAVSADIVKGYDIADTAIIQGTPTTSYGTKKAVRLGNWTTSPTLERQAMFNFDLTAIPAGSTVNSAVMKMVGRGDLGTPEKSFDISVHKITVPWDESVTYATFGDGNGDDYDPTPISSLFIAENELYAWHSFDLDTATVEGWINNPSTNYGVMLLVPESTEGEATFYSKDFAGIYENYLPYIEVDYVPEPATMGLLGMGALALVRRKK